MKEGVDVVVTNYRTPDCLELFLKSFNENPPSYPCDLWIASNDPRADDLRVIEGSRGHHVIHKNYGYGRTVNSTVLLGMRENIAIFNSNIQFTPGSLDICLDVLNDKPDRGIVGPRQISSDDRIVSAGFFGVPAKERGFHRQDSKEFQDIRDASHVSGSAFFVKRSVWQEILGALRKTPVWEDLYEEGLVTTPVPDGAFLPTSSAYEDMGCSFMARHLGYTCTYFGKIAVRHEWARPLKMMGASFVNKQRQSKEVFHRVMETAGIDH